MTTGVESEADRAQVAGAVGADGLAATELPYEAVFAAAMDRIAALSRSWEEASGAVAGADVPSPRSGSPVTIPLALVEDATGALAARARAPRWRRRLAS